MGGTAICVIPTDARSVPRSASSGLRRGTIAAERDYSGHSARLPKAAGRRHEGHAKSGARRSSPVRCRRRRPCRTSIPRRPSSRRCRRSLPPASWSGCMEWTCLKVLEPSPRSGRGQPRRAHRRLARRGDGPRPDGHGRGRPAPSGRASTSKPRRSRIGAGRHERIIVHGTSSRPLNRRRPRSPASPFELCGA